jgi:hypothetical protein
VQLRRADDVSDDDMCERGLPGGDLNVSSTGYPDHGPYRDLPQQRNITTTKKGFEPGTSLLIVRRSDHQATGVVVELLICYKESSLCKCNIRRIYMGTELLWVTA